MLVLSRQRDQTICIGDDIEITVVDIRGDKVRIGVSAPRSVAVHRGEVYEAINEEDLMPVEVTKTIVVERLNCYAPGDGALSFVWLDMTKGNSGVASGRKVMIAEAQEYLALPEEKHLRDDGYRIVSVYDQIRLVRILNRLSISGDKVFIGGKPYARNGSFDISGRVYRYKLVDEARWLAAAAIQVFTTYDGQEMEVRHISTVNTIRFWIENEAILTLDEAIRKSV